MHHVALDRPGPDDRDLDDEVVEAARLQPRQHVHLRPALDLEHAERIALAQHVVDAGHLARDGRQLAPLAMMLLDQVERLAHAGQHAEREHVDLEDAQLLDVVLVPFDEGAVGHRAIADRHRLGQQPLGQDEAADMLGQMPRHADHLLGQRRSCGADAGRRGRAPPRRRASSSISASSCPSGSAIAAVTSSLRPITLPTSRIADARAVMDHRRRNPRAVAAVLLVDVLDHFLAPLMLEIDVDVGRLLALLADEALEQQVVGRRVDRGDPQAVTDRAVGRATRAPGTGSADRGCARRRRCRGRSGNSARSRAFRSARARA